MVPSALTGNYLSNDNYYRLIYSQHIRPSSGIIKLNQEAGVTLGGDFGGLFQDGEHLGHSLEMKRLPG
jgi:hypothetical protein